MRTVRLTAVIMTLILMAGLTSGGAHAQGSWWNSAWHYRVPVAASTGSYERYDKPVEVPVNFTSLLSSVGVSSPFDENSLRVLEVNGGGSVIDTAVAFQFDRSSGYDASTNASGTLVILLAGMTPVGGSRLFHVYFEVTGSGIPAPSVAPLVTLTDDVFFEGQSSYKVETSSGTYYYHKQGGGFAGMKDRDNLEWLGYHPSGGSDGAYRGIPNMVFDINGSDFFHPGFTNSSSSIVSTGPLKATFRTKSIEPLDPWEALWEIYPGYARMSLIGKGRTGYWFLYEGTPGGGFDGGSDFVVRSDGARTPASNSWEGDLSDPEWVYFGDGGMKRTLFLVNHANDGAVDSYRQQENLMTVFGFGRSLVDLSGFMSSVPAQFTIGFAEDSSYAVTSKVISSSYRPMGGSLGSAEKLSIGTPAQLTPLNGAVQVPSSTWFTWTRVSDATGYHLQVSLDPGFASGLVVDDAAITDTARQVSGLLPGSTYYWRVRARQAGLSGAYSSIWNFSTSQAMPVLKSPADGAAVPGPTAALVWTNVTGASAYHLQVSTDPAFAGSFLANDSTLIDTVRQVSGLITGTRYYWRVAARMGGPPSFSAPHSFVVSLPPPQLVAPANNQAGLPTSVTFVWRKTAGAAGYIFQVAWDSTFSTGVVVNDAAVADTFRLVTDLGPNTRYFWHVAAKDNFGVETPFGVTRAFNVGATAVGEEGGLPDKYFLDQNYPNPFNPSTTIRFGVAEAGVVRLEVFTVLGEKVATLVDGPMAAGVYSMTFTGERGDKGTSSSSSGLYLYRFSSGSTTIVRKMLFLK